MTSNLFPSAAKSLAQERLRWSRIPLKPTALASRSAAGSSDHELPSRPPLPNPEIPVPAPPAQEPPASLAEALHRQRERAADVSGRRPPLQPSIPQHYASLPPRRLQGGTDPSARQSISRSRSIGFYTAVPRPQVKRKAVPVKPLGIPESVRQARKDAIAPKVLPGMGQYAAKVKAAGLGETALPMDVVQGHPVFAAALEELSRLEQQEKDTAVEP